jgi:hypothetical protein
VVEDFEGEPEVAPEPVPEVVREEAPVEGAMIAFHAVVAPSPSMSTIFVSAPQGRCLRGCHR